MQASAQQEKTETKQAKQRLNTFKINVLSPFVNAATVAYERKINAEYSFQTTASYMDFSGFEYETYRSTIRSFSLCPEIHFMLISTDNREWYVSAFARYIYVAVEDKPDRNYMFFDGSYLEGQYHSAGLGLTLGKKFTFKNRFTLEAFAGPVYSKILIANSENKISGTKSGNTNTFYGESLVPKPYVSGYGLRGGILLGYKF